jgi:TolB-like protein/cytochrome c-type biogenesis protein CcmH/NrfG
VSTSENKAVFLSYASQDAEAAKRICEALRAAGVEVWFDQSELRGGDAWDAKIRKQIKECALFVPVISANTQARTEGYFRLEWRLADQRTHLMAKGRPFLLPIVIDETRDTDAHVPDSFVEVQWMRLPDEETRDKFCARVKALLVGSATVPGTAPATPSPLARAREARPSRRPSWMKALVAILILALGAWGVSHMPRASKPAALAPLAAPAPTRVNPKSVAVLPFENLSDDKETGYFADGMQEDIITNLTFIPGLRVVPRATAMRYRDSKEGTPAIAKELGVSFVLTGSVRRNGGQIRLTGTLINARKDEHVWVKSYVQELRDVFAIQASLATEIAAALQATLTPETQKLIQRVPTRNAAAYDLYLKAREIINRGTTVNEETAALLTQAVELDPKFALAWAWLAKVHGLSYMSDRDHSPERIARAKTAIDTAVRLAPEDPEVALQLGYYYYHESRNYARAREHVERAARLQPGDPNVFFYRGGIDRRMGRWVEALENFRRASELDPGNGDYLRQYSSVAEVGRRYDEVAAASARLVAMGIQNQDAYRSAMIDFLRDGSSAGMDAYLAAPVPKGERTFRRRGWDTLNGNAAAAHGMASTPTASPRLAFSRAMAFLANDDLIAARAALEPVMSALRDRLRNEPANATVWSSLACMEAIVGHATDARAAADKAVKLLPESADRWAGPGFAVDRAFVLAWTGDKDAALAEYRRLLRTPGQQNCLSPWPNVHVMKKHPAFAPLRGNPRFEALLNDPKNNAPLF